MRMTESSKVWVEIRNKEDKSLVRIIYNPYGKSVKEVIADWIPPEFIATVYGIKTN